MNIILTTICTYDLKPHARNPAKNNQSVKSPVNYTKGSQRLLRGVMESKTDLRSSQNCKPILNFNCVTEFLIGFSFFRNYAIPIFDSDIYKWDKTCKWINLEAFDKFNILKNCTKVNNDFRYFSYYFIKKKGTKIFKGRY